MTNEDLSRWEWLSKTDNHNYDMCAIHELGDACRALIAEVLRLQLELQKMSDSEILATWGVEPNR